MFYLGGRPEDICRFGVRYSNGARAETGTGFRDNWFVWGEDDTGSHNSPDLRLTFSGHSGGATETTVDLLLYPSPPAGAVELFVEWPAVDLPETKIVLTPDVLEAASDCVVPLTPEEENEIRRNLERPAGTEGNV